jgi:hypothetical protein
MEDSRVHRCRPISVAASGGSVADPEALTR